MSNPQTSLDILFDVAKGWEARAVRAERLLDEKGRENARLRDALHFYADPATYEEGMDSSDGIAGVVPVDGDRGARARALLAALDGTERSQQP